MTNFHEINLNNYDHEDVAQLNEWGIYAVDKLERLHSERRQMFRLGMWFGILIGATIVSMTVIVFGG